MPKMTKISFTLLRVERELKHDGGNSPTFFWDSSAPGLGLKILPSGNRVFVFQKRLNGKVLRIVIGNIGAWKLPQAQAEARRLANLVDQGIDPRELKKEQKAEQDRKELLVSDVWRKYLKAHKGKWSDRHYKDNEWLSRKPEEDRPCGILYPLLSMQMTDVNATTIIQWLKDAVSDHENKLKEAEEKRSNGEKANTGIQGKGAAIRQGYVRARAFFQWANQHNEYEGIVDPAIFAHSDVRDLIPKSKPKNDVLEKGQLNAWFDSVQKISNRVISSYLQILLLTGARRNELSMLKWEDCDFKWGAIWLKDKVEEEGRKIPMTNYVRYLLESLPKVEKNPWVFTSTKAESGRMVEPRIAHKRALSTAGLPSELSIHGLRRSFASLSEWCEMPVGIVAQIMGHRPSATAEKHYKRRPIDLLALWHQKLESWILEQAGVTFNAKAAEEGLHAVSENTK